MRTQPTSTTPIIFIPVPPGRDHRQHSITRRSVQYCAWYFSNIPVQTNDKSLINTGNSLCSIPKLAVPFTSLNIFIRSRNLYSSVHINIAHASVRHAHLVIVFFIFQWHSRLRFTTCMQIMPSACTQQRNAHLPRYTFDFLIRTGYYFCVWVKYEAISANVVQFTLHACTVVHM